MAKKSKSDITMEIKNVKKEKPKKEEPKKEKKVKEPVKQIEVVEEVEANVCPDCGTEMSTDLDYEIMDEFRGIFQFAMNYVLSRHDDVNCGLELFLCATEACTELSINLGMDKVDFMEIVGDSYDQSLLEDEEEDMIDVEMEMDNESEEDKKDDPTLN